MLRSISNIPIFRRIFIAFALAAAIPGIVIVSLGGYYLNILNTHSQAVQVSFAAQNQAYEQKVNLMHMNALLQARVAQAFAVGLSISDPSMTASDQSLSGDILTLQTDFARGLTSYQQSYEIATSANMSSVHDILLADDPSGKVIKDQQAALDAVAGTQWNAYKQAQDHALNLLSTHPTFAQANAALSQANARFAPLSASWQRVVDDAARTGNTVTVVGPGQTRSILIFTALAFLFTILVIIITGYLMNLTITQPLRRLALLTRRIARGDTSARANIRGHDEIYMVAASMNNMLDNIVHLIQEAQSRHAHLQAQVEKLVSEVSGVGEGDLRVQAEVTTDDLGVLADSFNYMVEELSNLIVRVKMLTHEVENATSLTFDRMSQVVESADQQIHHIAEATVEVGRMADLSHQVAERAQVLSETAYAARQSAQDGRNAARQTVEGMERIHLNVGATAEKVQVLGERSREINNIVEVISNIAHQTNRLALDAAIQAAMAGDNGKGFGAVAADIRRLAEQAKEQATMITRIVRSVLEDIGAVALSMNDTAQETSSGTRLVQEAGMALESIFAVVEGQANEIETINQMTARQLQLSEEVAQIMQNASAATQRSSLGTHEASQQMGRLARLAEQLLASVEAFKLREEKHQPDLLPSTPVIVTPEQESQELSVSGVFRTITSSIQPPKRGHQYPGN